MNVSYQITTCTAHINSTVIKYVKLGCSAFSITEIELSLRFDKSLLEDFPSDTTIKEEPLKLVIYHGERSYGRIVMEIKKFFDWVNLEKALGIM